jgi:hypothetical protein
MPIRWTPDVDAPRPDDVILKAGHAAVIVAE